MKATTLEMSTADQAQLFGIQFDERVTVETDLQKEARIEATLKQLGSLLNSALKQIQQVGLNIVRLLDEDRVPMSTIAEKSGVPTLILRRLERVGRQRMHPSLYLGEKGYSEAVARLPYSTQVHLLDEGGSVDVLVGGGDVLQVKVEALQPIQIKQVFGDDKIRTVPEQRAWVESQKTLARINQTDASKTNVPYEVIGKKLTVHTPMSFSLKTLERIVAQMKAGSCSKLVPV